MLSRRTFVTSAAATLLTRKLLGTTTPPDSAFNLVARTDRARILTAAATYLTAEPITVTAAHSPRSAGGLHDYFSQSDYWWPDPANPNGPYIRRDGLSNPDNFPNHRDALIRLSLLAPTLAAAFLLTAGKPEAKKYAAAFTKHLLAWFVDPATRMNPNLQFAQAITNLSPGRGIGIIDTLQLVEVVRAARVLEAAHALTPTDAAAIRAWFADYLTWMTTSKNGGDEKAEKNNHGTCWLLQVAEFSQFAHRPDLTAMCRDRFRTFIIPGQIAPNGSLPLELARTKPYSYSLFDMDVLAGVCQSLSTSGAAASDPANLWTFKTPTSGSVADTVAFLEPFIADKSRWPYPKDVEYFDDFPSRRPALLFAGLALHKPTYLTVWSHLPADTTVQEVIRNLPIRQPLLWV